MTNIDKPLDDHGNNTTSSDHQTDDMPAIDQLPAQQTTRKQEAHQQLVLKPLAMSALGNTGADIERLIREARQKARRQKRKLNYDDIKDALSPGQNSMSEELLWRIALHESGHALAMIGFDLGTIRTISVGIGAGGFIESNIRQHATQDEDWISRMLAFTLAGRAAEMLVLGSTGMGSGGTDNSDLAQATHLALDAETNLGFGKHHPLLYRRFKDQSLMLSQDHQLAQRVNTRLEAAEAMAKKLLNQNRDVLLELANRLATAKVLDGAEVQNLIGRNMNTNLP
ncbi:MAG: ATP-dependent Zn protease [Rhizobiaceae bacterium]|nr:ATP-dependent Zn protease [Rhizobiaceae bacterium]